MRNLTVKEIPKIFEKHPNLKSLVIVGSGRIEDKFGNKGAKAIADALKTNNTLTNLNIPGIFLIHFRQ